MTTALHEAVAAELADRGEIATRVVVVAEVIDRALWVSYPDDSPAWEVLGLLEYAAARERARAAIAARVASESEDDDE